MITKQIIAGVLCAVVSNAAMTSPSCAQKALRDSVRVSEYPVYNRFLPGDIVKFGIQTGFIFTKDLDTGMDCGGRISQQFFHPYFKLTSQLHFWAASKKNLDVGVAGIEESVTYNIPLTKRFSVYGGFAVGYISMQKEVTTIEGSKNKIESRRDNNFEPFITAGIEYALDKNRSVFVENKIGSTALSHEIHLVFGLNFYRAEKTANSKSAGNDK